MNENLPAQQSGNFEITASASAAAAKAMIESRYYMAIKNPRSWDDVRQDILKECKRPAFANNKSAFYKKPIGKGVEGLGIRFVEVALRCMKNVLVEIPMVHEDDMKEVFRVTVTDLESNITYPMDVKVSKTVERSKPSDDGSYLSVRKNSYGKEVYTVPANDDDLLNKRLALISKAIRTLGLRIIPGDIQDEAEETILRIRKDTAAKDPDGERKKICDAFAGIGVRPSELSRYLGHDIGSSSPAEIVDLRGLYGAIKDGEATWKSAMENKMKTEANQGPEIDIQDDQPDSEPPGEAGQLEDSPATQPDTPAEDGGQGQDSAEPAPEEENHETVLCPDREGDFIRVKFCNEMCKSRKKCKAFVVDAEEVENPPAEEEGPGF